MKTFNRTKPLIQVLRELPIGETITIPNSQARHASVRYMVYVLKKKEGIELKATQKGLINKMQVTKIK